MNRIIRSRLSCIAVVLIISMTLLGCNNCDVCNLVRIVLGWGNIVFSFFWMVFLCPQCLTSYDLTAMSEFCKDNPNECSAMFEQMHMATIEFCEEYPEECQRAFDAWVESSDAEAEE